MDPLSVYQKLADSYDRLGQASMRDRFLMLAAEEALEAQQPAEAERLRQRLLQGSPHHMIRPYASFAEAARAADVQTYLSDLRTNYPPEVARQLLESLQENDPTTAAALNQALPVNKSSPAEPSPRIPPTAPLIDLSGHPAAAKPGEQRQEQRPAMPRRAKVEPYPLREEETPPTAPLARQQAQAQAQAQAQPARAPVARPVPAARPAPQPIEATLPFPAPSPQPGSARQPAPRQRLVEPSPAAEPPPRTVRERSTPSTGVGWMNMLLVGVVLTAALALAAFTLLRPFLPDAWLQ
jgi:hypothetical protein